MHIGEHHETRDEAAQPRDDKAVPGDELDENARDAPESGAGEHLDHGDFLLALCVLHGDSSE